MQITPGTGPSLTVGGRVFTDLTNLVILWTAVGSTNQGTFRRANGTSGYQVPVGKKFVVHAVRCLDVQSTTSAIKFAYTDNDCGVRSATAFTNGVQLGGDTATSLQWTYTNFPREMAIYFEVPAGKYLSASNQTASTEQYMVYGYEVPA